MKLTADIKLTLISLIVFLALIPFDLHILNYQTMHADCRPFFEAITDIGLGKWYVVPSGVLFLLGGLLYALKKLPQRAYKAWLIITQFFFSVAAAGLIADILKRVIARARPIEYLQHHVRGIFYWHEVLHGADKAHFVSLPSGHATTMFAAATAVALMLPQRYRGLRIAVFVFASVIAYSRIVVEAHYASDVMAGVMVGCWSAVWVQRYWLPMWKTKILKAA